MCGTVGRALRRQTTRQSEVRDITASNSMGSFDARFGVRRGVPGDEVSDDADERDSLDSLKMASCVSASLPLSPEVLELGSSATRSTSVRQESETLQVEVELLHKLIEFVRTGPDAEAQEVFRNIRACNDPLDIAKALDVSS